MNPPLELGIDPLLGVFMKVATHPVYHELSVTCACGNAMSTRSTRETQKVDICSACHPFYTGNAKMLDTEGRVERFKRKYDKTKK